MRHGIRTPASTYPNDPYINDTFYPVGWGQITNVSEIHNLFIGINFQVTYTCHFFRKENCGFTTLENF